MKRYLYFLVLLALCKKETINGKYGFTGMTSFKLFYRAQQDTLQAVITADSIKIYWPADQHSPLPDSIAPVLTLAEHATVSPAYGKRVKVRLDLSNMVTAENGQQQIFKVKLINNGTLPAIHAAPVTVQPGQRVFDFATFENVNTNASKNTLRFAGADGRVYIPQLIYPDQPFFGFMADASDGSGLPAGTYSLRVGNGAQSADLPGFLTVTGAVIPYLYETGSSDTLKLVPGQTLTLPVRHLKESPYIIAIVQLGGLSSTRVEILGTTADKAGMTIRIPDNIRGGVYAATIRLYLAAPDGTTVLSASPSLAHPIQIDN